MNNLTHSEIAKQLTSIKARIPNSAEKFRNRILELEEQIPDRKSKWALKKLINLDSSNDQQIQEEFQHIQTAADILEKVDLEALEIKTEVESFLSNIQGYKSSLQFDVPDYICETINQCTLFSKKIQTDLTVLWKEADAKHSIKEEQRKVAITKQHFDFHYELYSAISEILKLVNRYGFEDQINDSLKKCHEGYEVYKESDKAGTSIINNSFIKEINRKIFEFKNSSRADKNDNIRDLDNRLMSCYEWSTYFSISDKKIFKEKASDLQRKIKALFNWENSQINRETLEKDFESLEREIFSKINEEQESNLEKYRPLLLVLGEVSTQQQHYALLLNNCEGSIASINDYKNFKKGLISLKKQLIDDSSKYRDKIVESVSEISKAAEKNLSILQKGPCSSEVGKKLTLIKQKFFQFDFVNISGDPEKLLDLLIQVKNISDELTAIKNQVIEERQVFVSTVQELNLLAEKLDHEIDISQLEEISTVSNEIEQRLAKIDNNADISSAEKELSSLIKLVDQRTVDLHQKCFLEHEKLSVHVKKLNSIYKLLNISIEYKKKNQNPKLQLSDPVRQLLEERQLIIEYNKSRTQYNHKFQKKKESYLKKLEQFKKRPQLTKNDFRLLENFINKIYAWVVIEDDPENSWLNLKTYIEDADELLNKYIQLENNVKDQLKVLRDQLEEFDRIYQHGDFPVVKSRIEALIHGVDIETGQWEQFTSQLEDAAKILNTLWHHAKRSTLWRLEQNLNKTSTFFEKPGARANNSLLYDDIEKVYNELDEYSDQVPPKRLLRDLDKLASRIP